MQKFWPNFKKLTIPSHSNFTISTYLLTTKHFFSNITQSKTANYIIPKSTNSFKKKLPGPNIVIPLYFLPYRTSIKAHSTKKRKNSKKKSHEILFQNVTFNWIATRLLGMRRKSAVFRRFWPTWTDFCTFSVVSCSNAGNFRLTSVRWQQRNYWNEEKVDFGLEIASF